MVELLLLHYLPIVIAIHVGCNVHWCPFLTQMSFNHTYWFTNCRSFLSGVYPSRCLWFMFNFNMSFHREHRCGYKKLGFRYNQTQLKKLYTNSDLYQVGLQDIWGQYQKVVVYFMSIERLSKIFNLIFMVVSSIPIFKFSVYFTN